MTLTPLKKEFLDAISKIDDEYDFLLGMLHLANTDELKQKIIDGINNGTLKTSDDVIKITEEKESEMWIEGFGFGYPIDEETYEKQKTKKHYL